jgi:hypothetical protein
VVAWRGSPWRASPEGGPCRGCLEVSPGGGPWNRSPRWSLRGYPGCVPTIWSRGVRSLGGHLEGVLPQEGVPLRGPLEESIGGVPWRRALGGFSARGDPLEEVHSGSPGGRSRERGACMVSPGGGHLEVVPRGVSRRGPLEGSLNAVPWSGARYSPLVSCQYLRQNRHYWS